MGLFDSRFEYDTGAEFTPTERRAWLLRAIPIGLAILAVFALAAIPWVYGMVYLIGRLR